MPPGFIPEFPVSDRECAPKFLASLCVVGGNEAAILEELAAAIDSIDYLALNDQWASNVGLAFAVAGNLRFPHHSTGACIEC